MLSIHVDYLGKQYSYQYGEKLPSDIPIHELTKSEFERLKVQSLSPFKAAHMNEKVDNLEKEVKDLKSENINLKESLQSMSKRMDDQANIISEMLL